MLMIEHQHKPCRTNEKNKPFKISMLVKFQSDTKEVVSGKPSENVSIEVSCVCEQGRMFHL